MAESIIQKNSYTTFQSQINISSYNSENNMYTCPSDGYLKLVASGSVGNASEVINSLNEAIINAKVWNSGYTNVQSVFVKGGTKIYLNVNSGSGALYYIQMK